MNEARGLVRDVVSNIKPHDSIEHDDIQDVLKWIDSNAPIFRIARPDNPPMHLVAYFVPYDEINNLIMLIDHTKAHAWLPPGGHVDINEDPKTTVAREAEEELGIVARFDTMFRNNPLFITVNKTKPPGSHIDVSLWYVISADNSQTFVFDPREINSYRWFDPSEVLSLDIADFDRNMHRYVNKFQQIRKIDSIILTRITVYC